MSIQLAAYKGISFQSDCIRLLTYSEYSHIAVLFTDDIEVDVDGKTHFIAAGSVIEAWNPGGVRLVSSLSDSHTPHTPVDLFAFKTPLTREEEQKIVRTLIKHLGQKYSYGNVIRFVPIVRLLMPKPLPFAYTRTHVFCSELALEACADAGRWLLERCRFWEIPPRDVPRSPLLYLVKSVMTV